MSREERLLRKIEKKKAKKAEQKEREDKMRNYVSGISITTGGDGNDLVSKGLSKVDDAYERTFSNSFNIFSKDYYPDAEVPEERIKSVYEKSDGTIEQLDVEPLMIKPWVFNYFYSPAYRARLALTIFLLIGASLLVSLSMSLLVTWHTIVAMSIVILLIINVVFRYMGWGVWKWPMPKIPYLSDLRISMPEVEEEASDEEEYEEALEQNKDLVPLVKQVEDVRNGHPSPATVLTRWMNGIARLSEQDLIDMSGGSLDTLKMKLLLKDDEDAWLDVDTVDTLAKITGSSPREWRDTWYNWSE